ncbi:hypothetical protein EYF80_053085 [Liparis tanakae]|uniref:Uncharacterized protein n=1 Tax=Liparis tanakae TaxID=230148 RepID=A0A4Z2F6K9_9TELE|nr:hypothetical protein EYF80_053085 [Liparis tanakae]
MSTALFCLMQLSITWSTHDDITHDDITHDDITQLPMTCNRWLDPGTPDGSRINVKGVRVDQVKEKGVDVDRVKVKGVDVDRVKGVDVDRVKVKGVDVDRALVSVGFLDELWSQTLVCRNVNQQLCRAVGEETLPAKLEAELRVDMDDLHCRNPTSWATAAPRGLPHVEVLEA